MFSTWTRQLLRAGSIAAVIAAIAVAVPFGLAVTQYDDDQTTSTQTTTTGVDDTQASTRQAGNPTVDDVLDNPQHYYGQEVRLEGEVDDIYSSTVFAMEDDQDLFGEDRILILSVMPPGARPAGSLPAADSTYSEESAGSKETTDTASSNRSQGAMPAVELIELLDDDFREGKLVAATGTVYMFNRAALEQEFGTIDWGPIPSDRFGADDPVLVLGAREYAAFHKEPVVIEEQAVVIEPEPLPEPLPEPALEPEPAPAPEPQEPAAEPEPLPRTATPLPLIGLTGLLSLLAGLGIRTFRK